MARKRKHHQKDRGDPFARIERAADAAADEVLAEDLLLRKHGIISPVGRSR